jgi:hypothetical protein
VSCVTRRGGIIWNLVVRGGRYVVDSLVHRQAIVAEELECLDTAIARNVYASAQSKLQAVFAQCDLCSPLDAILKFVSLVVES